MPDGTSFFSTPRTNNWFYVGEWNICKQLTSRRHPTSPKVREGSISHRSLASERRPVVRTALILL